MNKEGLIKGFSKLTQEQKVQVISDRTSDPQRFLSDLRKLRHPDSEVQEKLNSFSENTLTNFPLPFGIAPNFLINGKNYIIPMVVEESSVVAAASSAARFWYERGGFHAEVIDVIKTGQIHFQWNDAPEKLKERFPELKKYLTENTRELTSRMEKRGGGIKDIELIDLSDKLERIYYLRFSFLTADSMGANFINSVLEESAALLRQFFSIPGNENSRLNVLMSILSNYTPECRVKVELRTTTDELESLDSGYSGEEFAKRFIQAVQIARHDTYRAVTHNKGIYNGIDAVIIATGNDYRAVEAGGHAYAARDGKYRSLSYADMSEGEFIHGLEVPLSVGTVGGLTSLHPLANWSFELLGGPEAEELMMIAASAGLANNYSAIKSLVTVGIQKGHMKMHLENILSFLGATNDERIKVRNEFLNKTVSHSSVENYLNKLRSE
jgi:hydroxymethylglutaryl-CoA reductase